MVNPVERRKEITSSVVLILFSALFLVYTTRYPLDDWESPGPAVFPLILGALLLLLAAGVLLRALLAPKAPTETGAQGSRIDNLKRFLRENQGEAKVILLTAMLVLYVLMIQWVGFFVTTCLFVTLVSRLVEDRGWGRPVALAAGVGLFCYLLFEVWIKLSFPRGILF
ncbi:MAG: tripartite tricarboxylate transporter TctB family protein [Syntrophales bacterium]